MQAALPQNVFPASTNWHNAYNICLGLEQRASKSGRGLVSPLVCSRILGYMLIYAPLDAGRDHLADEILSCADDGKLRQLGDFYYEHFIKIFRPAKGRTPAPSLHPSRQSFNNLQEELNHALEITPKDHRAVKIQALARDGYQCMVTGCYDETSVDKDPDLAEMVSVTVGAVTRETEVAHIFPSSINKDVVGGNRDPKTEYAASIWAVIDHFCGIKNTELNGANIHRLENVMTLDMSVHVKFDRLHIWFEETGTPNQYQIQGREHFKKGLPDTVMFTTTDPSLPLPALRYLKVHATCAKVANLSGAAEYIDKVMRDLEDIQVLAADGSSADVLNHALKAPAVF